MVRALDKTLPAEPLTHWNGAAEAQIVRWQKRLNQIAAIDFFGCDGRRTVERLLAGLEARLAGPPLKAPGPAAIDPVTLADRTWVKF